MSDTISITKIKCPCCRDYGRNSYLYKDQEGFLECLKCGLLLNFDKEYKEVNVSIGPNSTMGIIIGRFFDMEYLDHFVCKRCNKKEIWYVIELRMLVCLNCYSDF